MAIGAIGISTVGSIGIGVGTVGIGPIGSIRVGGVDKGGVSLGLPLAQTVLDQGAGADSQGATIGVLLGVQSRGAKECGDLVDSSLEITVISSNSLVSSDGNGNSGTSGDNLGLKGQRLDGRDGVCVGVGSVGVGGVGEGGGVDKGGVSLGLPLAVVGDSWDDGT